ncbi:hypothetical protein CEUSTIGMA_g4385.t1 [Chlamydomonas eustigma]|uniref:Metallo-beta-lactamase domain-containing protein n=1 Tax=Chlamydomonas eustigma TaxID=1157962 RepID=A0A250X1J3_9CHLO|nr:hypothetical protein CEUSTIGMA_g4385.t1 [Chlamydomonas eustigma]|eukprot:GAX76938.1 hypothetical protein CEUSTIGMA_g4385.t1 [Chlamydomonas eustigma]
MSKRRAQDNAVPGEGRNKLEIIALGAGNEVGRSCIVLKYQGKSIMFDCGIHPGYTGLNSLPYLDEVDLTQIDIALITHFHLDHCAAVPFLLRKTNFKGRTFMTHPTKAIYHSLLRDFAKQGKGGVDEQLYSEADLDASMERIEVIDFMQTVVVNGIMITPYRAGHVLGAAMFMVEVAGTRCLYTGDYSRSPDRHMPIADVPLVQPDVVIIESTYGVSRHLPREEREMHFLQRISNTVRRGGRVLLPVVALGRSQELLLLLDEHWESHPELHNVPIYQSSGMMRKALTVYETYVEMMNEDIKKVFQDRNPFNFRHVTHLSGTQHFDDVGPCVLMATPSGLQSGASRDIFEAWCEDERNAVIICDFAVQGTLAREILAGPTSILSKTGVKKPLKCSVDNISFSAHADFDQTSDFLDRTKPPHVVLVHGEVTEMGRLRTALEDRAKLSGIPRTVYMPRNLQLLQIEHKPLRTVRVVGKLAEKDPVQGGLLRGVLVAPLSSEGTGPAATTSTSTSEATAAFNLSTAKAELLHPDDLPAFSKLHKGVVTQRQALATGDKSFRELRLALEVMFEGVEGAGSLPVEGVASTSSRGSDYPMVSTTASGAAVAAAVTATDSVIVGETVTVSYYPASHLMDHPDHVIVEWQGGRVADAVADAVVAVLLQV